MATLPPSTSLASAALARQARELFVRNAVQVLGEAAANIYTRLTSLVDQSANARDMQDRRDAWLAFQKCQSQWVSGTASAWKKAMLPPTSTSTRAMLAGQSFELMGNDVMESKILSSRLALRILDKASWEFNDLSLRVRHLGGATELERQDVLRPESLAQCMVECWINAGLTHKAWLTIQNTVNQSLGDRMVEVYHTVNEFLVARGVMVDIDLRPLVRRTADTGVAPLSQSLEGLEEFAPSGSVPTGSASLRGAAGGGGNSAMGGSYGGGNNSQGGGPGGAANAGRNTGPAGQQAGMGRPGGTGYSGAGANGAAGPAGRSAVPGAAGRTVSAPGSAMRAGADAGRRAPAAHYAQETFDETRMMTSATPLARAKMRAQGVIGQLKRLLTDKVVGFDDSRPSKPSTQLVAAMQYSRSTLYSPMYADGAGQAGPAGPGNAGGGAGGTGGAGRGGVGGVYEGMHVEQAATALRDQTTNLKKAAATTSEKATIEIVALMFQSILAEDRIPAAVRVWFARLQMPVLRLALSEPEFFGSLQHPARQLIDRMGACVLGFEADVSSKALEVEIKRVVQVIEQYPETGRRVYQLVFDEFQKFLSKFLSEQGPTQRVASVAQMVEEKETAAIQYTIELRNMLGSMPVRDEIREFLFKVWAEVLAITSVKNGPQGDDTITLKQVAADLVWAASAKPNRSERAQVIADLPVLLKKMRMGMGMLGFEQPRQDEQIKVISDTLADAFMSKTDAIDPKLIAAMSKRLKNLEDFISEDDVGDLPLDAESIELMLGIDTTGIEIITSGGSEASEGMRGWARELDVGNWFNLDHNGHTGRVQYAWRSQRGQLHLFAGPGGKTYLFQLRRLAAYLQAGLMTPVEDESLTVRATRNALSKLDANPERLLT